MKMVFLLNSWSSDTLVLFRELEILAKIPKVIMMIAFLQKLKLLRAQYPGFKEYIDQQFSKVTGEILRMLRLVI